MAGIHPYIVEKLDRVLQRVLAKVPANRYPSCEALYLAYRDAIILPAYLNNVAYSPDPAEGDERTEVVDPKYLNNVAGANKPGTAIPQLTQLSTPIHSHYNPDANQGPGYEPTVLYQPSNPSALTKGPAVAPVKPNSPARTPVMVRPPRLNVRTEPDQHLNLSFELNGETLKLGRELDNQLQVPLSTVSRHHATLYRSGPVAPGMTYKIVDNNSRNQLIYRGQIVSERVLEDGDVIEIGKKGYGDYVVFLTYIGPVFR
jgi:pSer/pThr/pTyr-binding forkhead associated (FHA) protein